MKVLVIGEGGREHALCWAIKASPLCEELYCAPGNAGIASLATCLPIAIDDLEQITAFAVERKIDLVVIGPERPLVLGLVNRLNAAGVRAFGPTAAAAILESSKIFTKQLCHDHGIPTARFRCFNHSQAAHDFIATQSMPIVIKVDGLAAGKGVTVARSAPEAHEAVEAALAERKFGSAGDNILIEEFLRGQEVSFFVLVDGQNILPLASARDYKPAFDGDQGPNTGGMGAYSPALIWSEALQEQVLERIIKPTIAALAPRKYRGVLYAGLMITQSPDGQLDPYLLEYNVRFGDPECQVLMARLDSDLLPVLLASCNDLLHESDLRWRAEASLGVVMAAKGYPEAPSKNTEIRRLAHASPSLLVFQASTAQVADGVLLACGGRALTVTACGLTLAQARAHAYQALKHIDWPQGFYRRDIGC